MPTHSFARLPTSRRPHRLAALGLVLACAAPLCAQAQFLDTDKTPVPLGRWLGPVLDLDGDGAPDVVGAAETLRNDGRGRFTGAGVLPHGTTGVNRIAAGDVDGDGDPDLFVANGGQQWSFPGFPVPEQNALLLNDGAGNFVDATSRLPQLLDMSWTVALADVDGDGDLDVFFGRTQVADALYLNDGTGTFVDASSQLPAVAGLLSPTDAVFGDVDGDGDPDLVLAGYTESNRLYRNDGTGRFSDATAALPNVADATLAIVLTDLDADGDPDLVFANSGLDRLCRNDGAGSFTEAAASIPAINHDSRGVAAADIDGDGDADLVFAGVRTLVHENDGLGNFRDVSVGRMPEAWTTMAALTDVDADGDVDAFLGDRILLNDGGGTFQVTTGTRSTDSDGNAVAFGDVDGDGDQDYVVARYRAVNGVVLNDGTGVFRSAPANMPGQAWSDSHDAALGDLDGDGDLDAVFVGHSHRAHLHLNDGTGMFTDVTATHMPSGYDYNECMELGDVDGDGDLDIVIGSSIARDRLYLNDGTARFTNVTATHMPSIAQPASDVTLGDVDGDGDLDMVFATFNNSAPTRLYTNDGRGRFRHTTSGLPTFSTLGVDLGDADGDGDLDLATVDFGQVRLFLNDGAGVFTDVTSRMPTLPYVGYKVRFFDYDEDGDLDLVTAHVGPDVLLQNDGAGGFTDVSDRRGSSGSRYIAFADVDGDGDLDLLSGAPERLTYNLQRHIHAPGMPVSGRGFELKVYARHSRASADIALPFVAAGRARLPLPPLGILGLDPATAVSIGVASIPQPAGDVSFVLPIPGDPALFGVTIHFQALIASVPGGARFTNVISETVLR